MILKESGQPGIVSIRVFESRIVQHNGFNIFQLKNIVVPGENTCSYSVVVITVDFEIHFT